MSEEKQEEKKEEKKPDERVQIRDVTEAGAAKDKELRFTRRIHITWRTDDGEVLEGEITIKRPTLGDEARIGVMMAELRQDKPASSIDFMTSNLHEWIAVCSVCVTQAPPWFDPQNMYDAEPVQKVHEEVVKFQRSFRRSRVAK